MKAGFGLVGNGGGLPLPPAATGLSAADGGINGVLVAVT